MMYDVIILWAWASGLFVWTQLSEKLNVLILEKNETAWNKLLLTWKWRCNFTNLNVKDLVSVNGGSIVGIRRPFIWIRTRIPCFSSAAGERTGSKPCCGRVMVFYSCINVWRRAGSNGHGLSLNSGNWPCSSTGGWQKAWQWNRQNRSPGYIREPIKQGCETSSGQAFEAEKSWFHAGFPQVHPAIHKLLQAPCGALFSVLRCSYGKGKADSFKRTDPQLHKALTGRNGV